MFLYLSHIRIRINRLKEKTFFKKIVRKNNQKISIWGIIYATNVMEAGKVSETPFIDTAYKMGASI